MKWREACKRSDSSIAVRIGENGEKIYRNSFGVWYLTPLFFERVNLSIEEVEDFLDWIPV